MNNYTKRSWVLAVFLLLAFTRPFIRHWLPVDQPIWFQIYKDVAHIYMGFLLCLCINGTREDYEFRYKLKGRWWLFWILNAVETLCAVFKL